MTDLTLEQTPAVPAAEPVPASEPDPAAPGRRLVLKANRIHYGGQVGSLYRIWLLNVFLSIITLGIYSFWGKTRMRRYVTGCFKLGGDHFEYTGTGKELFVGFAKVFPFLLVFYAAALFLPEAVQFLLILAIVYIIPVAIFMAMRYRLNRLTWRGIRGRLTGSPFRFGGFALWRMLLNVVSLGILIPASDLATYGYMVNKAGIGNLRARFQGKAGVLIGVHVATLILSLVVVGIVVGVAFAASFGFAAGFAEGFAEGTGAEEADVGLAGAVMGAVVFLSFVVAGVLAMLIRSFYHAALMREKMRGLTVGTLRFKCSATGLDVLKLRLGNMLILLFTLGLGYPLVIQRRMRFVSDVLTIGGDLESAELMQAAREKGAAGEGLDDLLGIDADLGLG